LIRFYCKTLYSKSKTSELAGDSRCNTGTRNALCSRKVIGERNKGGYIPGASRWRRSIEQIKDILSRRITPRRAWVRSSQPSFATLSHPPVLFLFLPLLFLSFSLSPPLLSSLVFFIPSIRVIRIESFNKKFCSPAESAPFCEFKWKSGRESGRGWRPGGRRALLACKLKCCHLNANKTSPRTESNVEKEGGEQRTGKRERKIKRERVTGKFGGRMNGKPGLTDRATEVLTRSKRKFRKEFLFRPPRASNYAP